ncbi:MAG TPA: spermidine/putrescine ABC transporter substrate-binding protein [Candidatus Limiplasma sp.]|nr:spermidine/putrescine ABC transporter substrate-binding protein [Candidatus Limiplasma sp.]
MRKSLTCMLLLLLTLCLPMASLAEEVVNVYNWEDYISQESLDMFTQETGITVNLMNFTTNEDMLVKVRNSPSSFDVVFPSDYCIERMIAEGLIAPIDFTKVPNMQYIDANLLKPSYDPTGEYSVPYMWGTVGILYNKTMVTEPVTSWGILFDKKYTNNVFMIDSIRDCLGVTLKYLGYSMNTRDPLQLNEAKQLLIQQKKDGIVKAYQVDETKDKMVAGEAALALVWSGDAQYAIDLNPDLAYVVPQEGSNIWVDGMVIPKAAKNPENALKFIDFMCRPDIAKINCEEIWYSSPNTEAIKLMGDSYINNLTMNPTQDIIDRCEFFKDIQDFIQIYNAMWLEIKSA